MIDTDKYTGHTEGEWKVGARKGAMTVRDSNGEEIAATNSYSNARIMADAPLLLEEVKRLREENDLLRSMQRDGIEASAHDNLLSEINRLREDNEKLHDAINRSFHAKISGSALEIYNGWWEGEEE